MPSNSAAHDDQSMLDLGPAFDGTDSLERELSDPREARRSIQAMVRLALRRGYATSIGDLLDQVSDLRQYKPYNGLLAILQRPHATYLLPEHEWMQRWRRPVGPQEHPLILLVPSGPVMFLFDVSQTEETPESRPLPPELLNPYAMQGVVDADIAVAQLTANAKHDGVRVLGARHGWSSAGCISRAHHGVAQSVPVDKSARAWREVPVRYDVLLNDAYSSTEKLATLAHELGHLYCGHLGSRSGEWWPSRVDLEHRVEEFEAESVARLVFRRIAPEAALPPHLDQYFGAGEPVPDQGWMHVATAAGRVIDMCQGWSPRKK